MATGLKTPIHLHHLCILWSVFYIIFVWKVHSKFATDNRSQIQFMKPEKVYCYRFVKYFYINVLDKLSFWTCLASVNDWEMEKQFGLFVHILNIYNVIANLHFLSQTVITFNFHYSIIIFIYIPKQ